MSSLYSNAVFLEGNLLTPFFWRETVIVTNSMKWAKPYTTESVFCAIFGDFKIFVKIPCPLVNFHEVCDGDAGEPITPTVLKLPMSKYICIPKLVP